jgi:adenosylcobinamide kinase/adenosylcobinamide-phosphate guanylyltransferase
VEAARGAAYDVVLMEETFGDLVGHGTDHLDLVTFPEQLRRLREVGAVTDDTDVVAVHLSHRNPATAELSRRLADWGARVVDDGTDLGVAPRRPDPRRTLVLGGARSGKSREAERLLAVEAEVTYVATGYPAGDDPEWGERVRQHRMRRPAHWVTEETLDLVALLHTEGPALLVDCHTLWLTRVLDRHDAWERPERLALVDSEVDALVAAWGSTRRRVVAVSNEVGQGVVPATASGRLFRDAMGRLNARLAAETEDVRWCTAGRVSRC